MQTSGIAINMFRPIYISEGDTSQGKVSNGLVTVFTRIDNLETVGSLIGHLSNG